LITVAAAALAILPITKSIKVLVDELSDPIQFKNNYLVPCVILPGATQYNVSDLCFCYENSQFGPDNSLDGCKSGADVNCVATACGRKSQLCTNVLTSMCLCDQSFYQWECMCDNFNKNPNVPTCDSNFHMVSPPKVRPYITQAFSNCYNHYELVLNLLWAIFGMNVGFSALLAVISSCLACRQVESKIPTFFSTLNTLATLSLIIAVAVYASKPYCEYIPAAGVRNTGAYDTTASVIPGCIAKHQFDTEADLLYQITTAIYVTANKPVQAFLTTLGLLALPAAGHHGYSPLSY